MKDELPHGWIPNKIYEHSVATPNKIAVITESGIYTYAQLQQKIKILDEKLQSAKVKSGQKVGLCLGRTIDYPVAVLALMKRGATFVPLPTDYPKSRLDWIIENSQISFVLSDIDYQFSTQNSNTQSDAHIAYIIYTSGSTGQPKGVVIQYESLNYCTENVLQAVGITHQDVCLHVAPFAFSASMRQLFLPLVSGATLALASEAQRKNPQKMWEFIVNNKISVFNFTPFYFKACLANLRSLSPDKRDYILRNNSIRLLLSASEPFATDLVLKWRDEYCQKSEIINLYGQTETTGVLLTYRVPLSKKAIPTPILPLGNSIPGSFAVVEDSNGNLHTQAAEGQIIIMGPGVGAGYLNQNSDEPSPFSEINWQGKIIKMYRTGDYGRLDETGCAFFLNRMDQQIKIRGQRVDIHEIEYEMKRLLPISDAVVFVEGNANPMLVAHIVPMKEYPLTETKVKNCLNKFLPAYMIPSFFIYYESFPKNANAKLDRKAMRSAFQSINDNAPKLILS